MVQNARRRTMTATLLAMTMMTSACGVLNGGESVETGGTGQVGSEVVSTGTGDDGGTATTAVADETSTGAGESDVDKGTVSVGLEALPVEGNGEALQNLIVDTHGPTDDVSGSLNRLVFFPAIPTPNGAHIVDMRVYTRPATSEVGKTSLDLETRFVADGSVDELVTFYETQLTASDWSQTQTENDTDFNGNPFTKLTFETPNDDYQLVENLTIQVTDDAEFPKPIIEAAYRHTYHPDPDRVMLDRFNGWYEIPVPQGSALTSSGFDTRFGPGRTEITLRTDLDYEESGLGDKSYDGLRAELESTLEAGGVAYEDSRTPSDIQLSDDNRFDRVELRPTTTESIQLTGAYKFTTDPFEGVQAAAADQSTDPIGALASAEEIEAVLNEIHGPTDDVSAQMQRLGRFPDIPTPIGAEIIEVTSIIDEVIVFGGDDKKAAIAVTEMWVDGEIDDVVDFYDTTFAGLGWQSTGDETVTEDEGQTKIRTIDYDIPGVDAGSGNAFELTVRDDIDEAKTRVTLDYTEFLDPDQAEMDRWLGWQGDVPLPEDATIESAGISTNGFFGQAIFYVIDYSYADRTEDEMRAEIDRLMAGSDYSFDDEDTTDFRLEMEHPFFTRASMTFLDLTDRTVVSFQASRPLAE